MLASAERLMEAEKIQKAEFTGETPGYISKEEVKAFYDESFESLCFESVAFSYCDEDGEKILENFELEIKKRQFVALTGRSGCGKSTLFRLILDLYSANKGRIVLKDTEGTTTKLDRKWRRLFAYVPQENYLMSGTIREIVAFADKDRMEEDEAIRRALQIACADEFIEALEQGMDTIFGERGHGLSEGQMQRIAIARAIFADSPILLLDEATGALDEETERRLLQNLKQMTNKTLLIVTHRPEALKICNHRVELGGEKYE